MQQLADVYSIFISGGRSTKNADDYIIFINPIHYGLSSMYKKGFCDIFFGPLFWARAPPHYVASNYFWFHFSSIAEVTSDAPHFRAYARQLKFGQRKNQMILGLR